MKHDHRSPEADTENRYLRDVYLAIGRLLKRQAAGVTIRERTAANDNDKLADEGLALKRPVDPMTLGEVLFELRLKKQQVELLRRFWEFPRPWHDAGRLTFSRRAVERWARAQPNPKNLAIVLRHRGQRSERLGPSDGT